MSHGTDSGYFAHLRAKTPTCSDCRSAHAQAERERRATRLLLHGSPNGLRYHRRTGTPVCDLCLDVAVYAELKARRAYYADRLGQQQDAA